MHQNILVYGGKGALGAACIKFFKTKKWNVISIDLNSSQDADRSITLAAEDDLGAQFATIAGHMDQNLKYDCILNVAGGWCGGNAASKDFIKNCDVSLRQSVWTSCISASLATKYLKDGGLLILPGAKASLIIGSGMIAYSMAKSCINNLTLNLSQPKSGLPKESSVFALLPITLDTPMNRKWMPEADHSTWTPLEAIAEKVYEWLENPTKRPKNGSLIEIVTQNGNTAFEPMHLA